MCSQAGPDVRDDVLRIVGEVPTFGLPDAVTHRTKVLDRLLEYFATPATGPDVERDAAIEEVIDAAIEINDVLSVRLSNALAGLDRFIATPATGLDVDAASGRATGESARPWYRARLAASATEQDTAQLDWRDSR